LSKNSHKNVTIKRHNFTKSERECVKGIIHNLSFQRLTDREIVQWLHDEKQIDLDRSTVSKMRIQIELKAEKWYIDLRNSTYKYIALYKERIDSLFSYQKKLHEIISVTNKPEVQLRAISELHSIEMSIFSLWKQLPELEISDTRNDRDQCENTYSSGPPEAIMHIGDTEEKEEEERERAVYFGWKEGDAPLLNGRFRTMMEEKYGVPNEPWDEHKWIQCSTCKRWFKNTVKLEMHTPYCLLEPIV
jgi:hypothetical protein